MSASRLSGLSIRPIRDDERAELAARVSRSWGSSRVVSRGVAHEITDLPCLLATDGEKWLGVAAYRLAGDECELVLIEAFERGRGIGTALLEAAADLARESNSRRLLLVTSNSNVDALRFYQRRGMHLVRVWVDALTEARKHLKPEIPLLGDHGIPIRDELELELLLQNAESKNEDGFDHRGDA
jgi:GNAT superfamily N-acetyltransferase